MQLIFITKNQTKWQIAKGILEKYGIDLVQESIETPEIQAQDVDEVVRYSTEYASKLLNKPTIKTDVGYFIEALNGFPGPYVKYINAWLSSEDILSMMKDKANRKITIKETVALAIPSQNTKLFTSTTYGQIAKEAAGTGQMFDKILIRDGQDKIQSLIPPEEMLAFWQTNLKHFHELGEYLSKIAGY